MTQGWSTGREEKNRTSIPLTLLEGMHGAGALRPNRGDGLGPSLQVATRLDNEASLDAVVVRGPSMQGLVERIARAARSSAPLLLSGEAGTGKRAIARLVHELSPRIDFAFARLDCAALSTAELEAELLGFKRVALPGATRDREGLLQIANRGTLLLENVNAIDKGFQEKLCEILSSGEYHRLGERWEEREFDVRVIATVLRETTGGQKTSTLTRGLVDQLSVISLDVPSLREHSEDIEALLEHFASVLTNGCGITFDVEAARVLRSYSWPGNIQELQNALECGHVLGNGTHIVLEDLPVPIQNFAASLRDSAPRRRRDDVSARSSTHDEIERRCIVEAMTKTGADRPAVARLLVMTQRTLAYRIAIYGLEAELADLEAKTSGPRCQGLRQLAKVGPRAQRMAAYGT